MKWTIAAAIALSACTPSTTTDKPEIPPTVFDEKGDFTGRLTAQGSISFGGRASGTLAIGEGHSYTFRGQAGGRVTINETAALPQCSSRDATHLDAFLFLFGPPNASGQRGVELTRDDDSGGSGCQARITSFQLPVTGEYLIVATSFSQQSGGQYTLKLDCASGVCAPPVQTPQTFAETRIAQADIDAGRFSAQDLFEIGRFLFRHNFQTEEGLGNGLSGGVAGNKPRPNLRLFHNGGFGGPGNTNCIGCHNRGGEGGGAELSMNQFAGGDGERLSQALIRNAPAQFGDGYLEQLALEMSTELKAQLDAAKMTAASSHTAQPVDLRSKGVSYGRVVVAADGTTLDTSGLAGIDPDLTVKPFAWKGRGATLRRFVELSLQINLGMQSQPLIARHCATPNPNGVGNGPDCQDPDGDGVKDEITEGQLTAFAIYEVLQPVPVRENPIDSTALARVQRGESLFTSTGCASCHVPRLDLNDPVHREKPDLTGAAPFTVDMTVDGRAPRLRKNASGKVTVELFSDLRRHDMGASLADVKPSGTIPASVFLTRPIWGVGSTAPYMHDGRAPTLRHAILAHDGEGAQAKMNYLALSSDDQLKLVEFLQTLRAPRIE